MADAVSAVADAMLPPRVSYRPASHRLGLGAWLVSPTVPSPDREPIIAIHGLKRDAREQALLLASRASASGHMVIAPLFDLGRWRRYQQLVLQGRADLALIALLGELRSEGIVSADRFVLSGFSGGAQFAHRFAMLHPHLVRRVVVASAGYFTFPDDEPYPYGLGLSKGRLAGWGPTLRSRLDEFLRLPIAVVVGADDCVPDANTRSGPAIDRQQGLDRATRARRWTEALQTAARARGIRSQVTFAALRGCAHDFAQCVERGGLDEIVVSGATIETLARASAEATHPALEGPLRQ